jgi:hypothetical protein
VVAVGGIIGFGFGHGIVPLNPVSSLLFVDLVAEPGEQDRDVCKG